MNTTEHQKDPYAELKAAWEAGRRITCKRWPKGAYVQKGKAGFVAWFYPPEEYESEPLPADKWAAAINAAMNPAPADKLTDEKLGEIGAKAAAITINRPERVDYFTMTVTARSAFYDRDEPARTAFASAVREAVEKEKADREQANLDELMSLREELKVKTNWLVDATKAEDALRAEVKAKTKWLADANRGAQTNALVNQSMTQKVIEMQAVEAKQAEEIARLTAKSDEMCQSFVTEAAKKHEALAIIEQAIEMVNTPGTTKDNLPKAINAKIIQRDEFHDATLKKLDAAKEEVKRLLRLDATNRENCDRTHKALVESQLLQLDTQKALAAVTVDLDRMQLEFKKQAEKKAFEEWWDSCDQFDNSKPAAWFVWQARAAKEGEK